MKMKLFKEVFIADMKERFRDRASLFWTLAFPIIFVFIFGIIFSGGSDMVFNIGIAVDEKTPMVEEMIHQMDAIPTFNVHSGSKEEELAQLEQGQRSLVLELPSLNFAEISRGEKINISLYYDASNTTTNQTLIPIIQQMFSEIENKITGRERIFTVTTQPVQAKNLSNFDYILPGILAMSLMQLGLFGSFRFLSLREKKIIRGLGVTPLPRSVLLSTEILARLIMGLLQTLIIIVLGKLVFKVTIMGNLLALAGIVILGSLTFISMGYMLITFAKSMDAGQGIVQVVQFPMMFLSGIFFPIEIMPAYIEPVVKLMPLTYLGDALRQLMVGAAPAYSMTTNVAILAAWFVVTIVVSIRFWRWE